MPRLSVLTQPLFMVFSLLFTTVFSSANAASLQSEQCSIVFDAGSSGTRLYIYQFTETDTIEHPGDKGDAFATPVLAVNEPTEQEIQEYLNTYSAREIYQQYLSKPQVKQTIQLSAPLKSSMEMMQSSIDSIANILNKEIPGFNWRKQCKQSKLSVLATAGMRMAEQQKPAASQLMWAGLALKLEQAFSSEISPGDIQVRTISGYEEGLFAWLAVRNNRQMVANNEVATNHFGIVEMGGASTQITFPCPDCSPKRSAVRKVELGDETVKLFSYSFLGLGQDQAPQMLGLPRSCQHGAGLTAPYQNWQAAQCLELINVKSGDKIVDPLNYGNSHQTKKLGRLVNLPSMNKRPNHWVLTGAFNFMNSGQNIKDCCVNDEASPACFNAEFACYQANYREAWLSTLHISPQPVQAATFINKPKTAITPLQTPTFVRQKPAGHSVPRSVKNSSACPRTIHPFVAG